MMIKSCAMCVVALGCLLTHPVVWSADPDDRAVIRELRSRLERVESELQRLKGSQIPEDAKDQRVVLLVETPYLGSTSYSSTTATRFFVAKLIVVNLTATPLSIDREQISLAADDKVLTLGEVTPVLQSRSFRFGNQTFYMGNLKPVKQMKVRPGGTAATWAVFSGLAKGPKIPKLRLRVAVGKQQKTLDLNERSLGLLDLKSERIGPRGSLGLLTVSGELDTVNVGALVDAMSQLAAAGVARLVVTWDEDAAPIESSIKSWLSQAAQMAGVGEVSSRQFPPVPSQIRELHLATMPKAASRTTTRSSSSTTVQRIHPTVEQAVAAALQTAYERLPVPELLAAIQKGHPITRVAALATGGGRLPDENLIILLDYADHEDPKYQRAALIALRHFGDPRALDKLLHYTRKNVKPLSTVATQSLAASRYDAAHQALLEILKNEPAESKKSIVHILSQHPRAIWSETIFEFANDPGSEIVIDALTALARVGHPQLQALLVRSLNQKSNPKLRQSAFQILVNRQTAQSDEVALAYTLNHLKTKAPDSLMIQLLTRTKDGRAVPLLIELLKQQGNSSRAALIGCLTQIGDESVIDMFVEKYNTFESNEQTTILNSLRQMKSPRFRDLAQKALMSNNSSLVSTACQGLQVDGGDEAVKMLVKALEVSGNSSTWSYVCNALGQIGTAEAQTALRQARATGNSSKSRYAASALRSIQQRSPGYQYIYHAKNLEKQKKWDAALKLYTEAIGIDDALPDAFAGRAHVLLKQEKFADSLKDFDRALKIDPYHSLATSGKGIALVMSGKYQDGIKVVEDVRSRFRNDSVFAYNTACVYGRALEYINKKTDVPGRDEKLEAYKKMVIQELKRSLKLGFRQMDLMKTDPDLASVHDTDEFKSLLTPGKTKKTVPVPGSTRVRPKL